MSSTWRQCRGAMLGSILAMCFCLAANAQQQQALVNPQPQASSSDSATATTPAPAPPSVADDPNWHFTSLSYLWLPGIHGTVGAKGYDSHVAVSPIDVLKHFNIGLMGSFEPQYKRWSLPIDFVWAKLSDTRAGVNFPDYSVKATVKEGIFTQKVNYLVLDGKMVKGRGSLGVRGWYVGENLKLTPPTPPTFSVGTSQGWADVVAGANFVVPLSPKMTVLVTGDAGGGGANLDYQVASFVNLQIKPKWGIGIGYRYLDINYRNTNQNVLDFHESGILLTLLYKYGKQPPLP
jgi:hypothetical protein